MNKKSELIQVYNNERYKGLCHMQSDNKKTQKNKQTKKGNDEAK